MKKIVILLVGLMVLAGCSSKNQGIEVKEKVENKESFVLYISSTTCAACLDFKPTLKEVAKNYDVDYYDWVINQDSLSPDEKMAIISQIGLPTNIGTPTLAIIKEGKLIDFNSGGLSYDRLKDFFAKHDIIKG